NSQGRSGSFYSMAECWSRYALKSIVKVIESGAKALEVREQAFDNYNARIDKKNQELIWETYGQSFYYLTDEGRSVVNSPWNGPEYYAMLRDPDFADYEIS